MNKCKTKKIYKSVRGWSHSNQNRTHLTKRFLKCDSPLSTAEGTFLCVWGVL